MQRIGVLPFPAIFQGRFTFLSKLMWRFLWVLCLGMILSLCIWYIIQVNQGVSSKYLVATYEHQLENLSNEHTMLELQASQVNSLGRTADLISGLGFEQVGQVQYVRILGNQVVTK